LAQQTVIVAQTIARDLLQMSSRFFPFRGWHGLNLLRMLLPVGLGGHMLAGSLCLRRQAIPGALRGVHARGALWPQTARVVHH
jgi:hypothetical protein